mgnify:CR=1 FL=1
MNGSGSWFSENRSYAQRTCAEVGIKMKNKFYGTLLDLLFPRRCPVCDLPVRPFGKLVCEECRGKFTLIREPYCMKCGKRLAQEEEEYCTDCAAKRHQYDRGRAVFEYPTVADAVYRFKYRGRQEYADYFGTCMAAHLGKWMREIGVQALVPVPIHTSRYRSRGYNQAQLLCRRLGEELGIPVRDDLVQRVKKTTPMKDLSAPERQNNLKKAFKICCNDVKLDTIVIIDDIYTTGSTIDAISCELRKAGVRRIYYAALAIGKGI